RTRQSQLCKTGKQFVYLFIGHGAPGSRRQYEAFIVETRISHLGTKWSRGHKPGIAANHGRRSRILGRALRHDGLPRRFSEGTNGTATYIRSSRLRQSKLYIEAATSEFRNLL